MTNRSGDTDIDLLTGLDLRAFVATLRLRWWIIPAALAVSIGFLWAQESDLRTEPGSYYMSRTYEARDPTAVLASVGIDPVSVRAFPDANNQLLVLQSAEVRREIAQSIGADVTVTVSRSRPTFTLVDTLESDGQSSFVFQSTGVPTYSFACNEPVKATCEAALDAYIDKAVELRREAFIAGIADLRAVLTTVSNASTDPAIATKLSALDVLIERLETPFVQIASTEETIGATIASVRRPTYTFGVVAGLVIALLIILQLTVTDTRLRSVRQLGRLVGPESFLGWVTARSREVADRRTALLLHRAVTDSSSRGIRFIPLRAVPDNVTALSKLAELCALPAATACPYSEMTVAELTADSSGESDVLVVRRNRDDRREIADACASLRRSGRPFAGVLLVD